MFERDVSEPPACSCGLPVRTGGDSCASGCLWPCGEIHRRRGRKTGLDGRVNNYVADRVASGFLLHIRGAGLIDDVGSLVCDECVRDGLPKACVVLAITV